MNYHKLLIAIDGSPVSIHAAEKGIELASRLKAEIAVLYVIDDRFVLNSTETYGAQVALFDELRKDAKSTLDKFVKKIKSKPVKFLEEGEPGHQILKVAMQWQADLIVMGTHGRTGIKHFVMGSVAEHVIRHSKCPVFIVPSIHK